MEFQQIRNATIRLEYAGKTFLVDPWLAGKGEMGSFNDLGQGGQAPDAARAAIKMPMCRLPFDVEKILSGIDAYIVTHIHPDHIDMDLAAGTVGKGLDKQVPVYCQSHDDAAILEKSGFKQITVLSGQGNSWNGLKFIKTPARHGTIVPCGPASGVLLQAPGEKTLYIAGDTIWYDEIRKTLETYHPDVIITNNCGAELTGFGRILMDDNDLGEVCQTCPEAIVIASHMDTIAHASLTRATLRQKLADKGLAGRVRIPADGEKIVIP